MRRVIGCVVLLLSSVVWAEPGLKFVPRDGVVLVFGGQTLRGTRDYYALAHTPRPAGFSDYISYDVGGAYPALSPEHPRSYRGNDGLLEPTNWGGGMQCVDCLLDEPGFEQALINIGMYIGGPLDPNQGVCRGAAHCASARLARGEFDAHLGRFAEWLLGLEGRPVFLRIGYEFEGPWNGYTPTHFKAAWKHIVRFLDAAGVTNVAYVMHSVGFASYETIAAYFPEPDAQRGHYVDWLGYSHFQLDNAALGVHERRFARERGLKLLIGEAAPHTGDCERQIDIRRDTELALKWIDSFFAHVEEHRDVIRGIAYINENWSDHDYSPFWQDRQDQHCGGFFSRSNSRLNDNPVVAARWAEHVSGDGFLNWRPDLYERLQR